ncbi:MAG TPA: hypothetical protein G4O02_07365 [Caldilineae bacterium]|nr:hypothetical protein [Caldilineae bacterium]
MDREVQGMIIWILLALIVAWICVVGFFTWRDIRQRFPSESQPWRLVLLGITFPLRYWYFERPLRLSESERETWFQTVAQQMGLSDVRSARCPLCESEIPNAWQVDERGRLTVAPGPVECPRCDFRLDACRHCRYFQPAGAERTQMFAGELSWTHGRCTYYKTTQPVESITTREMARRMRERGYTHLQAPTPITDSYIPLEHCTAFRLEPKRLRHSGMRKPGRRQLYALRLLAHLSATQSEAEAVEPELSDEEQWLL